MGEGVTNPVGGAASSSADLPVEEPVASLLYAVRIAACWKLVLLLSLSCVVALRWTSCRRRRKKPCVSDQTSTTKQSPESDVTAETDNLNQKLLQTSSENLNDCLPLCETQNISLRTGSAGKSAPRLRRSVSACERGDSVSPLNKQPIERRTSFSALKLNTEVACIAGSQLLSNMDPKDIPGLPEPQPDSFFTWDSGGSSGEYSFVHTAVELPKYPDGAISEEERQMLLLYMQNGHPELLLNSTSGSVNSQSLINTSITDSILCDQAAVRGFLETIVEENSDDLKSPSECDETSLGWGSWDESDDDRVTVVEMQTSATNGSQNSSEPLHIPLHSDDTLLDKNCVSVTKEFPDKQESKESFSDVAVIATGDNLRNQIHENEMSGRKANEKHPLALTGEISVNDFSLQVLTQQNEKGGVLCLDNEMLSPECVKFCESKNQQIHFGESSAMDASEVSPSFNPLSLDKNDFETLWISANELEYPIETVNPWCENTGLNSKSCKDCPPECKNSDFFKNNEECSLSDSSLIVLGSENDLCLVPSKITQNAPESKENEFMFSDDFKDYFLPSENYVPGFNRDITEINEENVFVTENISAHLPFTTKNKGLRCFRIGFDSRLANEKQETDEVNSSSDDKMSRINSEFENSESPDLQEAVFSPRDGDVVYGSTWLSKPELKEQEKGTSGAEVRLTTMQADVQCTASIQLESPPPGNSRKSIPCLDQSASDDEIREVPNSLSRWQHHSDLQLVQEATSPITRWQHQTDLQMSSGSKQNILSDDESDDGLPSQLKHIYSSFKMKDKKMSRIRIKEDKNNNFKTLGLWDNETKVTLPPFDSNSNESEMPDPKHSEKHTLENKEEDLDDLELDMFAVNSDSTGSSSRSLLNGETDIDDALKSFQHLDDYSSHSEENSETEGSYIINTIENINIREGKLTRDSSIEIGDTEQNNSDNSSIGEPNKLGTVSPENTCSDNSDNCPLCTDPSFKKSNINNLMFSESANEEFMDSRVQSLFLNTFPTMLSLSQQNLCNNNTSADALTEKEPTDSPLTSSDSDEGIRTAKETKKRIKKRSKDNCNLELKHDDSGYVEDDEDDDEDDILCEKERNDLVTQMAPKSWEIADLANVRKSISSVFYESKSDRSRNADEEVQTASVPQSFKEFSKPLDHSISNKDIKLEHMDSEKWNIPENLSQFSAWLLDKELKKISCRDEMEKLIVSDIMSLREQTITQFLKNSASFQEKDIFKLPEIFENKVSINTKNIKEDFLNISSRDLNSESKHSSLTIPVFNDTSLNFETGAGTNMQNVAMANSLTENKDKNNSDGSLSDEKLELSTDELSEEYYNYNFNNHVSKVFSPRDENYRRKSNSNEALAEENCIKSHTYTKENDLKCSSNIPNTQHIVANNISNVQYTKCDLELNADTSDASNYINNKSELGDCKNDSQIIETYANMNEVLSESTQHESETGAQSAESSCQLTSGLVGDTTTGIESKVIDTTTLITSVNALGDTMNNINKIKPDSSLVAPSNIRDGIRNTNNCDELTESVSVKNVNDVAPSINDELKHFCIKSGNGLVGADDLMTCGMCESKGAYECSVKEGENNTSLAATRGETSEGKHVRGDSCHAYCYDDISTCSALLATQSSAFDNVSSSLSLSTDLLSDEIGTTVIDNSKIKQLANISSDFDVEVNIGSEKSPVLHIAKVCSRTALDANDNTQPQVLDYTEFSLDDLANSINKDCVLRNTDASGEFATSNVFENAILNIHRADSDFSVASKPEDPLLSKLDKTLESNTQTNNNQRKDISNELAINLIERDKSKPDIISTCIESVSNSKLNSEEFIGGRVGYERSQSVDRDTASSKETLETSVGQSKSTPDLRRCHEQQYNSSVPLSALLSKSVSQRIQDYLGHSTRGGFLNRSLPPTERSRHYRRICVSTETVVERAARFEARSRSTCGPKEGSVDSLASASRSGSCPPLSMRSRTLDAWNSDKNSRNYNKPTATVRPTFDAYRSSSYLKQYSTADDKGFNNGVIKNNLSSKDDLMELITGYTEATKVTHKPPVPPSSTTTTTQLHQSLKSARLKGKIASARKDFFERLSQQDLRPRDETKQSNSENSDFESGGLRRFDEFRRSAREERVRLAASHPDLGALEAAVRSSKRKIDQLKKKKKSGAVAGQAPLDAGPPQQSNSDMPSTTTTKDASLCLPYRRCTGEIAWASCAKRLQEAKAKSKGNLAQEQLEIVDVVHEQRSFWFKRPAETGDVRAQRPDTAGEDDYYDDDPASSHSNGGDSAIAAAVVENSEFLGTRARSMDFLLDADNREKVQPPENRLATGQGRVKSEHELRIERSLQNLTIPDWYKQSAWSKKPKEGFILRRGSEGSAGESRKRWQGFSSSRTPSATSLTTPPSSYSHRNIIVPKRVTPTSTEWRYVGSLVSSRESLTPASPSSLSPRECASATFQYGLNTSLSRWSSSRLSTSSAPLTALSVHRSFRQPYLGWRAAQASSGYTPSSGGASRSSPGVSPVAATTPLQGSRSESPRRGSQEHHYGYGLHQNQITSAATLRPDGSETADSSSRISPLALYDNTTNVFFNSSVEIPHSDSHAFDQQQRFSSAEMRRDRYSYTQSLYSGTVIVSPGAADDDRRNYNVDQVPRIVPGVEEERFSSVKSPQPPPRIWMESSFVGTKKDGSEPVLQPTRSIRIVPSDSVRAGTDKFSSARGSTSSSLRGTCATQTSMGEYVLRDFRRFGITL